MMFKGKVVAITGAAGGIGQSLCKYFDSEGAAIAAIDKSSALEAFAADLGIAHAIADVGDASAVADAFKTLAGALGPIDILVNNAGFSEHPTFARTDPAGWRHDVNGNLNGAYFCAHAVLPGMTEKGKGSIIAIG
jgi:NAD(P)-dependent dehydrogenase (short-subunit alcohol dehydrogenase family)